MGAEYRIATTAIKTSKIMLEKTTIQTDLVKEMVQLHSNNEN